jgi:hypothetical protein
MEEGRQHAPWLEVRGNHDNFDVKTRGGPQAHARAQFLCIMTVFRIHDIFFRIHAFDYLIRFQIRIRMLLFSSLTFHF